MRSIKGILIPNYRSSYAIESKVEGIKDWQMSCTTMDKQCPCDVVIAGESAVIMFDKEITPGSYDMDLDYMNTVISDIREARELDKMETPNMESVYLIDEKSSEHDKSEFTNIASKYLDKFAMEELSIIGLKTIATEDEHIEEPSPQPAVQAVEEEVTTESPEEESGAQAEEDINPNPVQVSVSDNGNRVEIVNISEDDAVQIKEFINGLKEMNMTVDDFLSVIKSIKAYMSTQAKVDQEPEPEPVAAEPAPETEVGQEDYSYQDAVPYPTRPGADPQSTNGGISDIAETEDIEAKAGEVLANESVDPYAGLDNNAATVPTETIAMESEQVETEPADPEELFNDTETIIATESEEVEEDNSNDPYSFVRMLASESVNDNELFNSMLEHRDNIPHEILMESVNINMYEKLINNTIINTNAVEKIKRGMRVNN